MASQASPNRKWLTLATVAIGVFMIMLDTTVVNVALPAIQEDFGDLEVTTADLEWIVNAYTLSFAVLMLLGGKLADLFGRRRVFVLGLVLFVGASVGCGLAGSIDVLIAMRAVQGVGGALINPASLSILTATFPPEQRGMAIGIWAGIIGLGVAIGPLVGGVLTEELDWSWIFFINVPFAVIAIVSTMLFVRESRDESLERSFDVPGLLTSGLGLFAITFALIEANSYGWGDPRIVGLLVLGVVLLAAFIVLERTRRLPILDLTLFRSPTFTGANVAALFVGFIMVGLLFFGSLYLQDVLGYSAIETGLAFLPMTGTVMFAAPIAGKLSDKVGPRWLITTGLGLLTIVGLLLSRLDFDSGFSDLVVPFVLGGIGIAFVLTSLTAAALAGVPVQKAGVGSAVINSIRQIGGAMSLAVLGAITAAETSASLLEGQTRQDAFIDGFQIIMLVAAAVALVGAVISAVMIAKGVPAPALAAAPAPAGAGQVPALAVPQQRSGGWAMAVPESAGKSVIQPRRAAAPAGRLELEVTSGRAAGTHLEVAGEPLLIGRAAERDGKLGDDPELSRRHALITRHEGRLVIEDLGSTNGTFVNGYRIVSPTLVTPGDSVSLGDSELVVKAPAAPERAAPSFGLEVVAGPAAGTRIEIGASPLVIGRAEDDPGKLGDDSELSRRHAQISGSDGRLVVEDLGSTNGTLVNGRAISSPTALGAGDSLSLGASELVVREVEAPSVEEPEAAPTAEPAALAGPADLGLRVVSGPAEGTLVSVGYEPFVMGRAEPGPGKLGDDHELSRRHAAISRLDEQRLLIEDLGSTNGTIVNGQRIAAPNLIGVGDSVEVGSSTLEVIDARAHPGPARPAGTAEGAGVR